MKNLKIWDTHYGFRPQVPNLLVENLTIHKVGYGVYHPNYENHVYRNVLISQTHTEPFNRGHDDLSIQYGALTVDGLIYASSMVLLDSARREATVPALARWLLGLGIAATLAANVAHGLGHGPVGAEAAAGNCIPVKIRHGCFLSCSPGVVRVSLVPRLIAHRHLRAMNLVRSSALRQMG